MSFFLRIVLLLLFVVSAYRGSSQGIVESSGNTKSIALGKTGACFKGLYGLFENQAGLASLQHSGILLSAERRFLLQELQQLNAGFGLATNSGTFGLVVSYFGYEAYNEQQAGIAYGRKLFESLSIGVQLNYFQINIAEYGNKGIMTFEGGLQYSLSDKFLLGIHIANPVKVRILEAEALPTIFRIGVHYEVSGNTDIYSEIYKNSGRQAQFRFGLEYRPVAVFYIRTGISTAPVAFSLGTGYRMKNGLALDISASYHQVLGFTPMAGVLYSWQ